MKISKDARKASKSLFSASFGKDGGLDETRVKQVAKTLAEKKPRHYMEILAGYTNLVRLELAKHEAVVESAADLEATEKTAITKSLRAKFGAQVSVEYKTVPTLLGGLRIKLGSDVWDTSVRSRLDALAAQFSS